MQPKILILIILLLGSKFTFGQKTNMRPLNELINTKEPGWDSVRAATTLYQTQVTTRSPMGAIIYETGGLLIDHGWIRILGSGSERLNRSIIDWNKNKSFKEVGEPMPFLLIADDILGGFFAINSRGISSNGIGKVFYFAPDALEWEETEMSYSDFLIFCFTGDLKKFYEGYQWTNWEKDIENMDGDKGMSIIPFLWTKEGKQNIDTSSKQTVPLQELWDLYFDMQKRGSK
jgi:hypothetical protein